MTIEQIRRLVAAVGPEAPTVEYKAAMTQSIAKAVAALANTYGGLVLVGVTDDRKIIGVKEKTIDQVSQHCHDNIEPPWAPEIVPVPIDDASGRFVLLLRIVPGIVPRPLLIGGAAPMRNHSTTYNANWQQLAALFAEDDAVRSNDPWTIRGPDLPRRHNNQQDYFADLILRTGLDIPIDPRASWRPLREDDVDELIHALNKSPIDSFLLGLSTVPDGTVQRFHRKGHNQSRIIRLQWQGFPRGWRNTKSGAVEALVSAEVPGGYGRNATRLQVHLDVVTRLAHLAEIREGDWIPAGGQQPPQLDQRMEVTTLGDLMDAMIAGFVAQPVVDALADLAQIDSLAVPQPRVLHLRTVNSIAETLDTSSLTAIPDASESGGAHLLADPALDLADADDRHQQVHAWLVQTALDAGLLGMEALLAKQSRRATS
ncbi:helix-turn-helix domain-containing protein [Actinomadura sp. GTD37]|uniref:AlbA family DNA-binding domain-containing protein n=1 Tax=Actinomadura sp. GTD37 TaxID=1778030 RepID=UPI0035BEC8A1